MKPRQPKRDAAASPRFPWELAVALFFWGFPRIVGVGLMFANLLHLISGRTPPAYERGFVREVRVVQPASRNPRTEKLILAGWLFILVKSWLMIWLVAKYHVPVNADWIIVPTVIFGAVCTAVYYWRN